MSSGRSVRRSGIDAGSDGVLDADAVVPTRRHRGRGGAGYCTRDVVGVAPADAGIALQAPSEFFENFFETVVQEMIEGSVESYPTRSVRWDVGIQ